MTLLPHTCGMNIAKIARININGISAHSHVGILIVIIRSHDGNIVSTRTKQSGNPELTWYAMHLIIRATTLETARLARHEFHL
jgi:hypothetical protein